MSMELRRAALGAASPSSHGSWWRSRSRLSRRCNSENLDDRERLLAALRFDRHPHSILVTERHGLHDD